MRMPKVQRDIINGLSILLSRFIGGVVPIDLPYALETQGIHYGLGSITKNNDWKLISKAMALDAVGSGMVGGIEVGEFSGGDWL